MIPHAGGARGRPAQRVSNMKCVVGGVVAAMLVAGLAAPVVRPAVAQETVAPTPPDGGAAPVGPDGMRRRLLDACVIEIWRRPEMKEIRATAVVRCQCAATKAAKVVTTVDVEQVSYTQPLVGPARDAILGALQTCGG